MKRDVVWNSVGIAAWSSLSLFLTVVVTRVDGFEASGHFTFAMGVAVVLYGIACYGVRTYQVSDLAGQYTTSDYVSLRILTTLGATIILSVWLFASRYPMGMTAIVLLLMAQRVIDAVSDVLFGVMQKNGRLYVSGQSLLFRSILGLVCFAAIDILGHGPVAACASLPLVSLVFLIGFDLPRTRQLEAVGISLQWHRLWAILRSIFLPFIISAITIIYANVARVVLQGLHPELQGYFGLVTMPLTLVILLFSFVLTPALVPLAERFQANDRSGLNRIVTLITLGMLAVAGVIALVTFLIGPELLRVVFGGDFSPYRVDLTLVMLIGMCLSVTSLYANVAIVFRRLRVTVIIYVASLVVLMGATAAMIGPWGIRGAVVAYLGASVVQLVALAVYYRHLLTTMRSAADSER